MRDWRATFLQVETDSFDVATSAIAYANAKVWSLETGAGVETSLHAGNAITNLEGQIIIAPKADAFAMPVLEKYLGPIKTKQRIDLCSLGAPLLVAGHVTSTSLDSLADYFGVPDSASKLDTMIQVWEGMLAAYLLKVE